MNGINEEHSSSKNNDPCEQRHKITVCPTGVLSSLHILISPRHITNHLDSAKMDFIKT